MVYLGLYLGDSRTLAVPAHNIRLLCNRMIMALSLIDAIMHYVSKTLNMQMDDEEAQFSLERKYLRVQVITCPCFFLSSLNSWKSVYKWMFTAALGCISLPFKEIYFKI